MAKGLLKSSLVVSAMTFISRILGLARDVIIAIFFGADAGTDAYFVAQKIPNFLRRLFAEGAFSQAFVPVLAEVKNLGDLAKVKFLVDRVAGTLGFILFGLTLLAVLGSKGVIMVFSPGFYLASDPFKFELAANLLQITFPYLFFIALTAFCGSILNTYGKFAVPAITPVFLNICIIAGAFLGQEYFEFPVYGLAWGIFIAGIVQLCFQLPFLWRLNLLPRPRWGFGDGYVKKILTLMIPGLFGVSVSQINLLIDTQLASFLETGSITWLYLSDRLLEFPLGVFGIAIATVILPSLSASHAQKSAQEFNDSMDWGLRVVLLIGLPAAVGLIVLAEPLMLSLFQYKSYSLYAAEQSSRSLITYALGLMPFMLIKVLAPGYFARQDTRTPVKIGIIAMVANIVLNLILFKPLAHVGLALATSIAAMLNAFLLFWGLRRQAVYRPGSAWLAWLIKLSLAATMMALVIYFMMPDIAYWRAADFYTRLAYLTGLVALGVACYGGCLFAFGVRPRDVMHAGA